MSNYRFTTLQSLTYYYPLAVILGIWVGVLGIGFLVVAPQVTEAQVVQNWTAVTAAGDNDSWRALAYDATTTRYVAVGLGTDRVMHSTNTSAWTVVSAAGDNDSWNAIAYGAGRFVAVASTTGATSDAVMTSTDGLTWATTSAAGNNDSWRSVTFGNGRFVAVASSTTTGGNDAVMTSTDGLTWATTSAAGNNDAWTAVTFGNGQFVAVGTAGDRVMYSTSGLAWATSSATGDNDTWNSITFGNGKFVAVGSSTSPSLETVMYSTNGINWTPVSAAGNNDQWLGVTFGNNIFVAVGSSTDTVMTSPDGLTWATTSAAGNNDQWRGILWANNRFVAVGTVGDRVMVNNSDPWTLTQTGFQFRSDNGSELAATKLNSQNSNLTWSVNTPLRLRTQINSTLATTTTPYYLQYKQTGEASWHSIGVDDTYPTIIATSSGRTTGNANNHAITIPPGEAGDLLLVVFSTDGAGTTFAPTSTTGWQKLGEQSNTNVVTGSVFYKFDSGNDLVVSLGTVDLEESSYVVYRIRNAGVPTGTPSNNSGANSDPANHLMPALLPHLIIATRSGDAQVRATVPPTGFGGFAGITANTAAGASTDVAHVYTTASSSNPGIFTSATEQWVSWTIAVPPKATPTVRIMQATIDTTLGSSTNDTSVGSIAWGTPGNGTSSDNSRATLQLSSTTISNYLLFSNYGFTIPSDATITGINVYIEKLESGVTGNVRDSNIRLFKAGVAAGINVAQTAVNWTTSDFVSQYGSSTSLWGTTWTPAEINAHNFGVGIAVAGAAVGANKIANIDHTIIQVYYTLGAPFALRDSNFIAAGGASTTAQLLTPGAQQVSNFRAGIIVDNTNPTPSIEIASSSYSELEWNIVATGTASTADTYTFRTSIGAEGTLSSYTATPQLTIGTAASSGQMSISGVVYDGVSTTTLGAGITVGVAVGADNPTLYSTTTTAGGAFSLLLATSSNGTNWTAVATSSAAGNDDGWIAVTYANGRFVAVGYTGDRVMTSPDGLTWTAVATSSAAGNDDGWYGLTYGNGRFVAVGNSGDRVMTSPDGLTWTAVATSSAAGNNDGWSAVTYGNGRFVAVGYSGDRVMTSPDGLTWTAVATSSAAGNNDGWYGLTYGNGRFVAVGNSGDRVMTSPDGLTWTAVATSSAAGNDDFWYAVTYANGRFVAVGYFGGDRVMTSSAGFSGEQSLVVYLDATSTKATTVSQPQLGSGSVANIPLYTNTMLVYNATSSESTDLNNLTFYDRTSDIDLLYTASSSGTSTIYANLLTATGTTILLPTLELQKNFTQNGLLNHSNGTLVFSGTSTQTATGTLINSGSLFNILITNTSGTGSSSQSVVFGTAVTATGTMTMGASTSVAFQAGATSTFTTLHWQGGASTTPVWLRSTNPGTQWLLTVTGVKNVSNVNVRDSNAASTPGGVTATSSSDSGNNTNWSFPATPVAVVTIGNHSGGQIGNVFSAIDQVGVPVFGFSLAPSVENSLVSQVQLTLSGNSGVVESEFSGWNLVRDVNSNRVVDASDITIATSGEVSIGSESGTVTWNTVLQATATADYLVTASTTDIDRNDVIVVRLWTTGITGVGVTGGLPVSVTGSVTGVQHTRSVSGSGGGGQTAIGGDAPAGAGIIGGGSGGGGGGGEGGQDRDGSNISASPNFNRPGSETGSWSSGANALLSDGVRALAPSTVTHTFSNFGFGIPDTNTIEGFEVKADTRRGAATGTLSVELSWNTGSLYTNAKVTPTLTAADMVYTLGSPSDTWGRSWVVSEVSDANFRLRVTAGVANIELDGIEVRVYNQAGGGGGGGGGEI